MMKSLSMVFTVLLAASFLRRKFTLVQYLAIQIMIGGLTGVPISDAKHEQNTESEYT